MTAKQEAKLNMYRATQKHCNDNAALLATVPAFGMAFTAFNTKISTIIATAQQEDLVTRGVTVDKGEAKSILCHLAADIAAPIFAYASANANNTLKEEVNFSYSDLLRTKDDILAPRVQNIKDKGTANIAALAPYGLTAASLTAFQATIDAYQSKVPTPRNSAAQKKTIRENLKKLITETDKVLKEQMDKTMVGFKAVNPDFVSTYKANRIIIDPGQSVTTLKGQILNAVTSAPVSGAVIVFIETANKINVGITGTFEIKPMPVGSNTLSVTAPGYKPKTDIVIIIKLGQVNTLNIQLDSL